MRRRDVLAAVGAAGSAALAGCGCIGAETWPGVGYTVEPQAVDTAGEDIVIDADIRVEFAFGDEGEGVRNAALAAFDEEGTVLASQSLGSIMWENVPEESREEGECGDHGTFVGRNTLRTDTLPAWIGLRYDWITESHTERRRIARLRDQPSDEPTAMDYELVDTEAVTLPPQEPTAREPFETVTFSSEGVTCDAPEQPEKRVQSPDVSVSFARSIPADNYRPVLDAYAYEDVLRFDVGLAGRPQLQRSECLTARYEASVTFASDEWEPTPVELRHLDASGEVTETYRT